MQGAHQLAGGVEIGGEIIYPKESQGCQQANLAGAVDCGVFLLFNRRGFECQEDDYNEQSNREKHNIPFE